MIPNTGRNVQNCYVLVIPMPFALKQTPKSKLYTQGMKGRPFSFPIIYPSNTHVWYPFCARAFCIVSSAADDALPLVSTMWHVVSHSVPWWGWSTKRSSVSSLRFYGQIFKTPILGQSDINIHEELCSTETPGNASFKLMVLWYVEFSIKIGVECNSLHRCDIQAREMGWSFSWHIVVIGWVWVRPSYIIPLCLLISKAGSVWRLVRIGDILMRIDN